MVINNSRANVALQRSMPPWVNFDRFSGYRRLVDIRLAPKAPVPGSTRYDKLAVNNLAFVQLASIRIWLRFYESAP
jgi:hypothetical protein